MLEVLEMLRGLSGSYLKLRSGSKGKCLAQAVAFLCAASLSLEIHVRWAQGCTLLVYLKSEGQAQNLLKAVDGGLASMPQSWTIYMSIVSNERQLLQFTNSMPLKRVLAFEI